MIELLLSVVGQRGVDALAFLLAFALTALMDSVFHDRLPHDPVSYTHLTLPTKLEV